jgi:hypothetical protein
MASDPGHASNQYSRLIKDPELLRDWLRSDAGKANIAALEIWQRWNDLAIKASDFRLSELNQWKAGTAEPLKLLPSVDAYIRAHWSDK